MSSYSIVDKRKLSGLFSKAAGSYDRYALLQAEISEELLAKLKKESRQLSILDVGVGTARLTEKLALLFPEAKILGLDLAFGMIKQAVKRKTLLSFIQADAQSLPLKPNSFDLIISNLSYQWVDNLSDAFGQIYTVLKKEGTFSITIFGKETLKELKASFFKSYKIKKIKFNPSYLQLPDEACVYEALNKAQFKNIKIRRKFKRKTYQDLFSLLKWLKLTGSNYSSGQLFNNLGSRQILEETAGLYKARYHDSGNIYASFEVIYAEASK